MLGALNTILKKIIGDKKEKDIEAIQPLLKATKSACEALSNASADDVRQMSQDMQTRIQNHIQHLEDEVQALNDKADELPLDALEEKEGIYAEVDKVRKTINEEIEKVLVEILPEAFAVIKRTAEIFKSNEEITVSANAFDKDFAIQTSKDYVRIEGDKAIWKNNWSAAGNRFTWDMVHYDVQLIGGIALHQGKVAEMATGEGKTLVATLPVFLNALANRGVHVVTVNDYLARRDSEWMGPLYEFHGLSVDCIDKHQPNSDARRNAYRSHITFGTNNEFGFDYLRDNMAVEASHLVQRKHHFAIIDEVDSVVNVSPADK